MLPGGDGVELKVLARRLSGGRGSTRVGQVVVHLAALAWVGSDKSVSRIYVPVYICVLTCVSMERYGARAVPKCKHIQIYFC